MNEDNMNALSIDSAKEYINNINFNPIINKLESQMGWDKAHALEICELYRRFLFLQRKYGHLYNLPYPEDIDGFWHVHILDTKNYIKDCDAIFGHYLNHYPYFGIDDKTNLQDLEKAFLTMQELYMKEFGGEPIYEVRGTLAKIISFAKVLFKPKARRVAKEQDNQEKLATN